MNESNVLKDEKKWLLDDFESLKGHIIKNYRGKNFKKSGAKLNSARNQSSILVQNLASQIQNGQPKKMLFITFQSPDRDQNSANQIALKYAQEMRSAITQNRKSRSQKMISPRPKSKRKLGDRLRKSSRSKSRGRRSRRSSRSRSRSRPRKRSQSSRSRSKSRRFSKLSIEGQSSYRFAEINDQIRSNRKTL